MKALIAPDKFKGTLTAAVVASVISDALTRAGIDCEALPMADGGDGTLDTLLAHGYSARSVEAVDALGRPCSATVAWRGDEAVVELAQACGMSTVDDLPRDPWRASSLGLGLAARGAHEAGARTLVLALGGSASTDGGIGLLQGLGFEVRDRHGRPVSPDLTGLVAACTVTGQAPTGTWRVLVDVRNPLVGSAGAAAVFGPQKGLSERECRRASAAMCRWARVLERAFGVDVSALEGAGAAGGVAAAAAAALGAEVAMGADAISGLIGLRQRMAGVDVVVTGEGSFDGQSDAGKAPGRVIELARELGKPCFVVAGTSDVDEARWRAMGVGAVVTCAQAAGSDSAARDDASYWLGVAARTFAERL